MDEDVRETFEVPLRPARYVGDTYRCIPEVTEAATPRVEKAIERLASRAAALLWVVTAIGILMLLRLIGGLA